VGARGAGAGAGAAGAGAGTAGAGAGAAAAAEAAADDEELDELLLLTTIGAAWAPVPWPNENGPVCGPRINTLVAWSRGNTPVPGAIVNNGAWPAGGITTGVPGAVMKTVALSWAVTTAPSLFTTVAVTMSVWLAPVMPVKLPSNSHT